MAEKYVDQYVWLSVPGGVEGWDLDELNSKIDFYNRNGLFRFGLNFFEWLSLDTNETYNGFSWWRSKLDSKVHRILIGRSNNDR